MKLTIKTLQGQIFKVDIEPDKLVKELKETIEKEQGKEYAPSLQKLIYNGKILTDETKLAEYEFDEKKFIVLMVTRPIPVPKPVSERETTTSKGTSATKSSTDERAASNQSTAHQQQSGSQTAVSAGQQQATARPTQQQHTTTTTTTTSNSQSASAAAGRASALNDLAALSMGEPGIANRLAAFMTQPQFRQMQETIQQNPHLLSSTIESLANSDPETYSFISENPDIFANALNHPQMLGGRSTTTTASSRSSQQHSQGGRSGAGSDGSSGPAVGLQQPVVSQLLDVSEHDKEAIERLKELGFSEFQAVQAYMACDKDEQLAANLLFQMDQ